ncbi:TetR/AcrR family transcriptional regulator [Hymenobacter properus]|uniref:TetR/AcrR family transcriptional regulator n=1 Tax=Hymenobacter properus TaxID=2791026 RepID=A0A931BFI5_9BACT|nr:TetR/AcrR family transcriptional regulator [Hymenobacter properus]MBF9140362.1 TetR/AcrR family transcriptional regulator [Hymenobacter properus]MBR7719169.1 TetR/AcrR family transcriptional regulator [Microvirga sp. SRT04]
MDPQKRSTEELILEAAQAVFLEKGLAGARMQEIADRAGINKALLHYYFRSKEKLSAIIISRTIGIIMPRMMGVLATDQDLFDKIREMVHTFIGFISRNSFLPLFVVNEINRNPHFFFTSAIKQERTYLDKFRQQVDEAVAAGRIRPITATQLMMNMMSMLIFPFLGKPVFQAGLGLSDEEFQQEMERRRTDVADFIIRSIQV